MAQWASRELLSYYSGLDCRDHDTFMEVLDDPAIWMRMHALRERKGWMEVVAVGNL